MTGWSCLSSVSSTLARRGRLQGGGREVDTKTTLLARFKSLCARHNLQVITMVFTDGPVAPGEGIVFGGGVLINKGQYYLNI